MSTKKPRVAVLRGGPSEEHEVSLKSGESVIKALHSNGCPVTDVFITKEGEWKIGNESLTVAALKDSADVVFIALHGTYGEDGQIQKILEAAGVPYTGSSSQVSALCINKAATKAALKNAPCNFARSILLTKSSDIVTELSETKKFTGWVLKPNSSGSSFGVELHTDFEQTLKHLSSLIDEYDEVLVEEMLQGTEVTCGVVNNLLESKVVSLPVVEIKPPADATFFDTEVKYNGQTEEICPAKISVELSKKVQVAAQYVHESLGLSQYSRSDFIIIDDEVFFLEVNTLPGLTSESLLPKEIKAAGITYEDFVLHLVQSAQK